MMTPGSDTAFGLREPLRRSAPIVALVNDLTAHGQVVSERTRRTIWGSVAAFYFALFVLFLARWITDVTVGFRPGIIVVLTGLALLCAIVPAILTRRRKRARTTKAGVASAQAASGDGSLAARSTLTVALAGLASYPDQALAEALVLPTLTAEGRRWLPDRRVTAR